MRFPARAIEETDMSHPLPYPTPDLQGDTTRRALSDIATTLADAIKGYEEMATRAEPDLASVVERLLALHRTHAAEVAEELARLGGQPEKAGSLMGTVHAAVATARDWLDKLDASAIGAILSGEERILDDYAAAIDTVGGQSDCGQLLTRQRTALNSHVRALST
jgi:uncharacterized protein (TIGR02284 family)